MGSLIQDEVLAHKAGERAFHLDMKESKEVGRRLEQRLRFDSFITTDSPNLYREMLELEQKFPQWVDQQVEGPIAQAMVGYLHEAKRVLKLPRIGAVRRKPSLQWCVREPYVSWGRFGELLEDHESLGAGGTRWAFRQGGVVVKLAMNTLGLIHNWLEADLYRRLKELNPYPPENPPVPARCRILKNQVALVMAYLTPCGYTEHAPEWANYLDCQQVGFDRRGVVRAYDYASNTNLWRVP